MTTLLVSDLHLDPSRPQITALFVAFLRSEARNCSALYILGDLFEAWIGDDADDSAGSAVASALRELHEHGVPSFFIHGNRDFLLGDDWARRAGTSLLADPARIVIEGRPTLLMHGDSLCIDDIGYQAFRQQVRQPAWQIGFLGRSLDERRAFAHQARAESRRQTADKDMAIMDVNDNAVLEAMRAADVTRLIHGHTHRPAIHRFALDGHAAERIVLGDWYDQGSVLRLHGTDIELAALSPALSASG